jgi:putative ABC transport system permease protein
VIKNYIKTALRILFRHKGYYFNIILGLALGLALLILAVLFTDIHFGFDRFHDDADRIYALIRNYSSKDGSDHHTMKIPAPVLPMMKDKFPAVEDATRFFHESARVIRRDEKKFYENRVWYGDQNFFNFFSFDLVSGNPETVLRSPNSVVITESIALKYFGEADPMGRMLTINRNGVTELMVTGICRDIPVDSTLNFDFLVSSKTFDWIEDWDVESTVFLKLDPGVDRHQVEAKFSDFVKTNLPMLQKHGEKLTLFPLTEIHIHSWHIMHHFQMRNLHPTLLVGVLGISVIFLLIVMVNFMNLSTARYMHRVKEVGIRKVVGASRGQLVKQFLGESVLQSICALPVAVCLFEFFRPTFLSYVGLKSDLSIWDDPVLILVLLTLTVVIGLVAGSYPAFFLSKFESITILKENIASGIKGSRVRKLLVVVQFSLSVLLIVFSLTQSRQLNYLSDLDLGYDRSHVAVLEVHPEMSDRLETLKLELLQHTGINSVGGANGYPFNWGHEEDVRTPGMNDDQAFPMKTYHVDYGFIEALDISVTRGRSFSRRFKDTHAYVLSEMAAKRFGWKDPIGRPLFVGDQRGTVVGVVEDFHFNHVIFEKGPAILYLAPGWSHHLFIRLTSPPDGRLRPFIEQTWQSVAPDFPFEYSTMEDLFETDFRMLMRVSEVFRFISIVSLFISCLGLIGLTTFTVEQRTKEIGIRKTLGATIPSVLRMLVSEFIFLVIVANCIAIPIAVWGAHVFLKSLWVDKVNLGFFIFILASFLSFAAALASVVFQSLKAATANPVDSLRHE